MEFVAIVERRPTCRYVYIPSLDTGADLPDREEPRDFAIALVAAALGVPAADLTVSLHHAALGETVITTPPTAAEVLHDDGTWRTAEHTGWLRQWHGPWGPLVSYAADGVTWTRAVHISRFRQPRADGSALPAPRRRMSELEPTG